MQEEGAKELLNRPWKDGEDLGECLGFDDEPEEDDEEDSSSDDDDSDSDDMHPGDDEDQK